MVLDIDFRVKTIEIYCIDILVYFGARDFEKIGCKTVQSVAFVLEKIK